MEEFLDLRAPQWIDFTENCSPVRIPDFFEKVHAIHERIEDCDSTSKNTQDKQPVSQTDVLCVNNKAQADLNIIKSTPVKMISPKHRKKEIVTTETTYNQVLSDAMKKLEFCKISKIRETLNKTTQESNAFKTPSTKIAKLSRSDDFHSVPNKRVQSGQDSVPRYAKVNKYVCTPSNMLANTKKTSVNHSLFKQDTDCIMNDFKPLNDLIDDSKGEENEQSNREIIEVHKKEDDKEQQDESREATNDIKDNKKEDNQEPATNDIEANKEEDNQEAATNDVKDNKEEDNQEAATNDVKDNKEEDNQGAATNDIKDNKEEDNVDAASEKDKRTQPNKSIAVLTWHNHRRNMHKRRTSINKPYVSLAEAVSRFQNETPKRFRTRSNKNNTTTSFNLSKLMQNRLKPTIPISPALISKNRTRPVTVLSQDEREKLEMEQMKKHQIKANPIPPSVLRGPRTGTRVTSVAKKPTTVASTSSTMQLAEKACAASSLQSKNLSPHHDKASSGLKNVVTKVVVTDPAGIVVEHEKMTFFGVPKDIVKNVTRVVPFSFEAREKNLQMKKEQRLKNLQDANKSKTEFHARPAPNFSKPPTPQAKQQDTKNSARMPVLPCPFSFEERDKNLSKRKEQLVKQMFEEKKRSHVFRANPVPVFKPVMVRGKSKEHLSMKDKSVKMGNEHAEKCEDQENREPNINPSKTESENKQGTMNTVDKQKAPLKARPLELNTDKRAKERREFDEKLKRKEMEEEVKRQEENKKRLELEKQMKVELRKQTEVKARPMPTYKPPIVVKATKQLTNPQSPAFVRKTKPKQA